MAITLLGDLSVFGQLFRFGLAGGFITLMVAGGYWVAAAVFGVDPMLSLTLNFLVFTMVGYLLHSNYSFRGHGSRDGAGARTARFFTVNLIGFFANQFFVWLLVVRLGGPTWWPVLLIVFVTPLLTFTLNRQWVFR